MSFFAKVVLDINNLILANGPGASGTNTSTSSSAISDIVAKILAFLGSLVTIFWGIISGGIYKISKLCLNIVDLLQFFVQKLVGIDIWSVGGKGLGSLSDLSEADVILRFILRPEVQRVFWAIVGIGLVLIILFSIISIIKSNYAAVTDESDKVENKPSKVFKKSLRAIFLFAFVPVLVIFGIVGSNAILASICNAIRGDNNLTIGGSIFTASSYDANKYREYASTGLRVPMYIEDATLVINPNDYDSENKMMELFYDLVIGNVYIPYVSDNAKFKSKQRFGSEDGGWKSWRTSEQYFIYRSEIAEMGDNPSTKGDFNLDFAWFYDEFCQGEVLNDKKNSEPIMKSIYDGNINANKKYYQIKFNFDETYVVSDTIVFPTTSVTAKIFNNSLSYNKYESFATIPLEYYVMADVIDYAIEQYTQLYYVNANNSAISWDNIDEYDKSMGKDYNSKGMFYVSYYDGTTRAYWSEMSATSERNNATYIICQKSSDGMTYIPLTQNNSQFSSSFLSKSYGGAIVARGVFAKDKIVPLGYNKPTVISEAEVDNSGNEITIDKNSTTSSYDLGDSDFAKYRVNQSDLQIILGRETVLSSSKVAYYTAIENKVSIYDRYSRPINTNLEIDIDNSEVNGTTYIKFDTFEQNGGYYLEEYGNRINDLIYNDINYSLYAKVEYKLYKVNSDLINDGQDFYICADLKIVGITGKHGDEEPADSDYKTMDTFESYLFKGWSINPVVIKSFKNLVVRDGNIYEVGTNALILSTSSITKNMIINQDSPLYKTNLNSFKDNPISYLPTAALYEYDTTSQPENVYYYNEYRMPVDKGGNLVGKEGYEINRKRLTATFTEFMYLHFLRDNSNKIVEAVWSPVNNANDSPLIESAIDGRTLFIASVNATVDVEAFFDESDSKKVTSINTAELNEISLVAVDGYNINLSNHFEISNNKIYCKDLGKTVINASDVKNAISNNELNGDYKVSDELSVKFENISITESIWKMSSIASYSNYFIYFSNGDITSEPYIDFRINLSNPSKKITDIKFVFRFHLKSAYYYSYDTAYRLDAGGFLLDYNFRTATGIEIANLFTTANINPLILIFSTLIVLSVFLKIIWGLIARIYEIVILYILMPAYASTIVIDEDSERFRRWKGAIIEKVLMAYGTLITFNLYLVLLPLLKTITTDFIQWNDLPTTITGFINSNFISNIQGFGSNLIAGIGGSNILSRLLSATSELTQSQMVYASFINKVIYVLFFLVLTTILSTAPKMINKILGAEEDLEGKSEQTKAAAQKNVETVGEYTSGRAALKSAKNVAKSVTSAVPGGQLLSKALTKSKANAKKARDEREANATGIARVRREERFRNQIRRDYNEGGAENSDQRAAAPQTNNANINNMLQDTSAESTNTQNNAVENRGVQPSNRSGRPSRRRTNSNVQENKVKSDVDSATKKKKFENFKGDGSSGNETGRLKNYVKSSVDNAKTSRSQKKTVKSINKDIKKDFKEQKRGYISSTYHAAKFTKKGKERNKINTFLRANTSLASDTLHSVLGVMKRPINRTRRHQVELQRRLNKSNARENKLTRVENRVDKKIVRQTNKDSSLSNTKLDELARRKNNIEKAKKAAAGRNIVLREKVAKTTAKQIGVKYTKPKADTISIPKQKGSAKDQRTAFARMNTTQFNDMLKKSVDFKTKLETAIKNTNEKINRNIEVKKNSTLIKELQDRQKKIDQHVELLKKENERREDKLRREKIKDNKPK